MFLWANYIFPRWSCCFCWRKYVDRSWEYINRSQTRECGNWGWGRAIPRKGIYKRNCRCSVVGRELTLSFRHGLRICLLGSIQESSDTVESINRSAIRTKRQCQSRHSPGFNPSFLRHRGTWGAPYEAVLNIVFKKNIQKSPLKEVFDLTSCDWKHCNTNKAFFKKGKASRF
jgi:hypothetical protein